MLYLKEVVDKAAWEQANIISLTSTATRLDTFRRNAPTPSVGAVRTKGTRKRWSVTSDKAKFTIPLWNKF